MSQATGADIGSTHGLLLEKIDKLDICCSFKSKDTVRIVPFIKPQTEQHQASVKRLPDFHGPDEKTRTV